jgi:hypothetical protein
MIPVLLPIPDIGLAKIISCLLASSTGSLYEKLGFPKSGLPP